MKLEMAVELNLKIPEVKKMLEDASRNAMRDTVVAVHADAMRGSPKKTGNNMRSIVSEVGPGGEIAKEDLSGAVYSTSGYGGFL